MSLPRIVRFPKVGTFPDGTLVWGEAGAHIPFIPQRFFTVGNLSQHSRRGGHAHKECQQLIIPTCGNFTVSTDNGKGELKHFLSMPDCGLYIPAMTWVTIRKFSIDAAYLVLASDLYDPEDYIRDYDKFLEEVRK